MSLMVSCPLVAHFGEKQRVKGRVGGRLGVRGLAWVQLVTLHASYKPHSIA